MEIRTQPTFQHVTWVIQDFWELPQENEFFLDSPEFIYSGDRYGMKLYPKLQGFRTVFGVRRFSRNSPERKVFFEIGLRTKDPSGNECYCYGRRLLRGIRSYLRSTIEENKDEYVPDGNLTIVCCMSLSEESRAGSSAQREEEQGGFPGQKSSFSSRQSPAKMEPTTHFPCTRVRLTVDDVFELMRGVGDSLSSPEFRFAGDTYCFRFEENGDTGDTDLRLLRLTSNFTENTVYYRVGYRYFNPTYSNNSRPLVGNVGFCVSLTTLEEDGFGYVFNGKFEMALFLRLGEQSSAGAGTTDEPQKPSVLTGIPKLQSGCRQILERGTESDACVVVRGKEFPVHGVVLPTRSNIFEREDKAMFDHDTTEKESDRLVVDDLDPESFGVYLEYLDTGEIQDKLSDDDVFGLYAAAEKYDVPTLKSQCVEHMLQNLSVDSFCDVMALALRPSGEELLKHAISFFRDNLPRIIRTPKWQQFNIDHGASVNEFLMKVFEPETQ